MALTEKQLRDGLATTIANLKHNLMTRFSHLKVKEERLKLLELVGKTINNNSAKDCFFWIAYESFAKQLDAQGLNNAQFSAAIARFNELPEIVEALASLQENLMMQLKRIFECRVSGSHTAFATTDSAAVSSPSSEKPPAGGSGAAAVDDSPKAPATGIMSIDFSRDALCASIGEWVEDRYSPVDERVASTGERRLRRMDSLARLLALHPTISVCSAVTLDLSREPQIIIGANVGLNGDQGKIFDETTAKLAIIKRHLAAIPARDASSFDSLYLERCANDLVEEFLKHSRTSFPREVLQQAAKKLFHAVRYDKETFTEEEKIAFLAHSPATIVLPLMNDRGAQCMQVRQLNSKGNEENFFELPDVPRGTKVNNIHAEQLIARYLFKELEVEKPLIVGVSKLCCLTCFANLSKYPVKLRGHHNQEYPGVIDIDNGKGPTERSKRRAITHAWASPGDTPERRLAAAEMKMGSPPRIGRLLFADASMSSPPKAIMRSSPPRELFVGPEGAEEPALKRKREPAAAHSASAEEGSAAPTVGAWVPGEHLFFLAKRRALIPEGETDTSVAGTDAEAVAAQTLSPR